MPAVLKSRFPEITTSLPLKARAAIQAGTERIAADARHRAPVSHDVHHGYQPGSLRDSIEARSGSAEAGVVSGTEVYGIFAAWYYRFPEFGTRYFAAEPFIVPAAESGKAEVAAAVTEAMRSL